MDQEYYDDYGYDDCQLSHQISSNQYFYQNKPSQKYMDIKDVINEFNKLIESLKEMLDMNRDNSFEVFLHYNFSMDSFHQHYYINTQANLDYLIQERIINDHSKLNYNAGLGTCILCFETTNLIQLGCSHSFCENCIRETIKQRVNGDYSLVVLCLQIGCKYRLPLSMLEQYASNLPKIICRKFIEQSKELAYCPGKDCYCIINQPDMSVREVTCQCGQSFCFKCKNNLHPPINCDMVKKWIEQIQKDEANIKWIALNTKICPFCKKNVERSMGCNFMLCKPPGGCGKAFCYVCSNPWEPDHKDHFKCNKYVPPSDQIELEKQALQKYNFYLERFNNSIFAWDKASKLLQNFKEVVQLQVLDVYEITIIDEQFVELSFLELIQSRLVMKWSYTLAYFTSLQPFVSSKIFDNLLQSFENVCEKLAIYLMKFLDEVEKYENTYVRSKVPIQQRQESFYTHRQDIQNSTYLCKNQRECLERAIQQGEIQM